jgi:hypothetical protein
VGTRKEGRMEYCEKPAVFLLEHTDGLHSAALMLNGYISDWAYAPRIGSQVQATEFFLQPDGPGANFGYLGRNIQRFFQTGIAPYPPARTLLTTGVIDAAMNSRYADHQPLATPWLDVAYTSYAKMSERPSGACLDRKCPDLLLPWRD